MVIKTQRKSTLSQLRKSPSKKAKELTVITIANKYHGTKGISIMRGTPLGNPFPIDENNPREVAIAKYHEWLCSANSTHKIIGNVFENPELINNA